MIREKAGDGYRALGTSLLIHLAVFVLFAITGLLTTPREPVNPPVEVVLYDVDGPGHGSGGGGGGGSPAPMEPPSPEDIVVEDQPVPPPPDISEVSEEETPQPSPERPSPTAPPPERQGIQRAPGGTGTGHGTGTGTGEGPGSGSGSGGGSGSGHGTGTGGGEGSGEGGGGMRPSVPPRLISAVEPSYPERLRREGVEGVVHLRLIVAADGSVESAEVVDSSGYDEMDNAARSAAYEYTFSPAENSAGDAVRCAISTAVRFQLN
ncbi:MAG: energy transducer TonB [Schwartzia sp. (in: firmicutes)]